MKMAVKKHINNEKVTFKPIDTTEWFESPVSDILEITEESQDRSFIKYNETLPATMKEPTTCVINRLE